MPLDGSMYKPGGSGSNKPRIGKLVSYAELSPQAARTIRDLGYMVIADHPAEAVFLLQRNKNTASWITATIVIKLDQLKNVGCGDYMDINPILAGLTAVRIDPPITPYGFS